MIKRKRDELSDDEESDDKEKNIAYKKNEKGEGKKFKKKTEKVKKKTNNKKKYNEGNIKNKKKGIRKIKKREEEEEEREEEEEEGELEEEEEESEEEESESVNESKEKENKNSKEKELIGKYKNRLKEMENKMEKIKKENEYLKLQLDDKNKEKNKTKKSKEKKELPQNNKKDNKISNENEKNYFNDSSKDVNEIDNTIPTKEINEEGKVLQSIQLYTKPTLVGLQNIGATCFMNATLQCLSQTKGLTNYFLKEGNYSKIINNNIALSNPKDYQLSPLYYELIQNLWKSEGPKYYAPYNFMKRVNDMNPLFKKGEAGDAKDFIIFILEQMHKELSKPLKIKNIKETTTLNQYDKNITFMNFFNDFTKSTSIISDLFYGFNETTNVCLFCKNCYGGFNYPICYNYGIFNLLIFPLEEIKNMKNNYNLVNFCNFYQGPTNTVNIDDCFLYNQKTDLFTGENKNYCNLCKQLCDSHYTSKIYISPNILILILNRGKGNIFKVKMDFQTTIDITNYVIQKDKPRIIYNLYGVITHLGQSGPNAHFVAACKSPVDGIWYRYNDAIVEPIKDFLTDVYNFGTPYILFYEKVN